MLGFGPVGDITPAGSPSSVATGFTFLCESGYYTLFGAVAGLGAERVFPLDSGQYGITGGETTIFRGYNFSLDPGYYPITGHEARLYQSSYWYGDPEVIRVTPEVTSMNIPSEPRNMAPAADPEAISTDDQDSSIEPRLRRT